MKHFSFKLKLAFCLATFMFIVTSCSDNNHPAPNNNYEVNSTDIYSNQTPVDESDTDKRKRIKARPKRISGSIALNVRCTVRGHGFDSTGFTDIGDSLYFEVPVAPEWYEYTIVDGNDTVVRRMVFKDETELVLYDTIP